MANSYKMLVMLPVMFAARKLDGEDPNVIYWLRVAYFSMQSIIVMLVLYTYIQASSAAKGKENKVVYVAPAAQPFADPNTKKKYTQTTLGTHLLSQARSLLGSTLFGIAMTSGLHFYRGMVIGLAIQSIMGPINLTDNALVKAFCFGKGLQDDDRLFEEKTADELTHDDEVVDESGNPVVVRTTIGGAAAGKNESGTTTLEELVLDTWDDGAKADLGPLMAAITKKNCNAKTKENGWTPLMVLSGLGGVKGNGSAMRQVIALGGNPAITDVEGWNAMHWAAFHGSAEAAKTLGKEGSLWDVKDKEGKKALEHARAEGNDDVAKILEEIEAEVNAPTDKTKEEGLRKRK
mmetsp:Transcript_6283/g.10403  ORF Transcript_6283/g.10403 Transcript_6283/m.10403 type:complete len:348 (+) Transcript_6283:224-1267(+)|eukprot:CAMPEP_0119014046 /NCGR_PEP_ID=MMETSP1176-20130426/9324_1 /TAXON_ID=265551 /ORGANISM="Synedropsis recta cf, Strain CCMP1620" /LENGTH=347 /DNA_ID=CAMNT_0006967181 /DNA_START=215 /DNA_END=1258 /DNA_ORIENTATION=+